MKVWLYIPPARRKGSRKKYVRVTRRKARRIISR
jgi:hypothetical protein